MSNTYNNPVANKSYTNRDFQAIFPELLGLAKTLTSRWDPSVSNESDPGVVLLKLNAIIADKLNYNLDKNVLECFPLSVTQSANARQLYKQLGYSMGYYNSGSTTVAMTWTGTATVVDPDYYVTIPKFTMVTDVDATIVYTLLGPSMPDGSVSISDQKLLLDGSILYWTAMQGIPTQYSINNSTVITADMLDSNNRLYFDTTDIAENGIFITHTNNANDYALWKKVDNLLAMNNGYSDESDTTTYYYSFGVSATDGSCYIEFSDDAIDLFKSGIEVVYLRTSALEGTIPASFLAKFESDLTSIDTNCDKVSTLTEDNVKILNVTASTGASDIETLDEAYKNYQRTIGTYNTLVTLRDYLNASISGEYASNGVVCSRNNDIQSAYKLMSLSELAHTTLTKVDDTVYTVSEDKALNAFNLKFYLTDYVDKTIQDEESYLGTFNLVNQSTINKDLVPYLEDLRSIEHEFTPILAPYTNLIAGTFRSNVCMFKAIFPIEARITSTYTLSTAEKQIVIEAIKKALYGAFSAKNLVMGACPDAADISAVITGADSRIYSVYVNDIVPEIYAVYWNGEEFKSINLTKPNILNIEFSKAYAEDSTLSTANYNLKYLVSSSTARLEPIPAYNYDEATNTYTDAFADAVGNTLGWGLYKFLYKGLVDGKQRWVMTSYLGGTSEASVDNQVMLEDISAYFTINQASLKQYDEITIEVNPVELIKKEILCKSILAGITPYFIKDEEFFYDVHQKCLTQKAYRKPTSEEAEEVAIVDYINSVKAQATITISPDKAIQLADNENLQFYAPNLLEGSTYNDYVKYEARIAAPSDTLTAIPANASYALRAGDYIIFYWKSSTADTVYQYHMYGPGTIITPTFAMSLPIGDTSISTVFSSLIVECITQGVSELSSDTLTLTSEQSDIISELTSSSNYLSGTSEITIKYINSVSIDTTAKIYWILNNNDDGVYTLFKENETTYTLNAGEYFIYANTALSELQFLGAGTKIIRQGDTSIWSVTAVDSAKVTSEGTSALSDFWFVFPDSNSTVKVVEQQFVSLGSGAWVKSSVKNYTFDENAQELAPTEIIKYSSLTAPTDSDWTSLPELLLEDDFTWEARSALVLSFGTNGPQRLAENHTIYYTQLGHEDEIRSISGVAPSDDNYPVEILSSQNIISTGEAGFLSVYDLDSAGDKVYPSFYTYKAEQDTSTIKYSSNGGASLYLLLSNMDSNDTITLEFEFTHPNVSSKNGGWILSLYNPYKDVKSLKVYEKISGEWTPVTQINSTNTEFAAANMYLLSPKGTVEALTTTISLRVVFVCHTMTKSRVLTMLQAFKYDPNDDLAYTYDEIQELFKTNFDKDNEFDYTFAVSSSEAIADPLASKSFLEASHIYNKNTICQINTTSMAFNIYGGKS